MFNVLTGFWYRWKIHEFETQPYLCLVSRLAGYLIKPFVRDKDIKPFLSLLKSPALPLTYCDFGRWYPKSYKQYGYFSEKTISVTPFRCGPEIKKIMDKIRQCPRQYKTRISLRQRLLEQVATTADGVEKLTTPQVTYWNTSWLTISWFAVRPAGYRTKIKFLHRYSWWVWSRC